MRLLRALAAASIALLATCAGPTLAHAQETTNRNTVSVPVAKYPAICLADSLNKKGVAEATKHQCAAIKAHVDSANAQLKVARAIKVTGPKTPPKPTTHPPPTTPHDSSGSPVDTITPVILPVPTTLAIVTPPGAIASGATFSPQPVVRFLDQFGATYPATSTITASLGSGLATITGGASVVASSGVAAFSTLGATTATTGANTITFSAPGVPSVTSSAFTVTAPPPPPPLPPPTIASFTASPSTIATAGNVTLAWSTTDATSLALAPAIGAVTGTTRTLTVSATTTFTLTATNSAGTATATATVTLVPPSGGLPATPGVAELPRRIVNTAYPTPTRSYAITANLQTALDTAKLGDEIRLAPGSVWTGNFILRKKPTGSGDIIIRADLTDGQLGAPGTRMRPSVAAALQLPKIQTATNNVPAIGTADSAHHYRLVGLDLTASGAVTLLNSIVRFGDAASNGQTVFANVPGDLIIDRSYVHAPPTLDIRRCLTFHSSSTAIVDSWVAECHSNNGDAQAINGYNGPGPFYIRNNHLEAGTEVIMWGGADPFAAPFSPADITVVYNHFTRPASWKSRAPGTSTYDPGQWQVKNLYESKNGCRQLLQGNVFENEWFDAQAGFAILFKSENQDGTAPYTQTCDVTVRFNLIQNVGSVFNLSGKGSKSTPNITAARLTVHDNYATGINTGIFTADGYPVQILGPIDAVVVHNTFLNAGASQAAVSLDGAAAVRFIFDSNVLYHGSFGVKGSGKSDGISSLAGFAPGYEFLSNAILGSLQGNSCSIYPATTQCPGAGSATGNGPDGRPLGADLSAVNGQTAGVVVAP